MIKLRGVPLFESTDQLFLDSINLTLTFSIVDLAVLKNGKVITVDLLKVLHLAEHYKLFFVDDFFCLLLKHVVCT